MALPTTIASTIIPDRNYHLGPFISGGNVYVFLRESVAGRVAAYKATDPTSSFSQQDSANRPTAASPQAIWVYQDGTDFHVASCNNAGDGGTNGIIHYHRFSASSDTWTEVDTVIESGIKGQTANSSSVSISVRSDGDRIVLYGGDPDTDMGTDFDRIDYARWEGVSWTAAIDVGGTSPANENRRGASVVPGSSDNMHFHWSNTTLRARTLDPSTNGLSTARTNSVTLSGFHQTKSVSYDDSGTQRVVIPFRRLTDGFIVVQRGTEDASGDISFLGTTDVSDSSTTQGTLDNDTPLACIALDGTTAHILFADSGTSDLWRDQAVAPQTSWGTDTEFLDAVTINSVSINIYDRSGTKLAMVYDNGGTVQYNEISLAVEGRPPLVRLPRHAPFRAAFY